MSKYYPLINILDYTKENSAQVLLAIKWKSKFIALGKGTFNFNSEIFYIYRKKLPIWMVPVIFDVLDSTNWADHNCFYWIDKNRKFIKIQRIC